MKLVDEEEAIVYVCGDAKGMAKGVTQAFVEILHQMKGNDTVCPCMYTGSRLQLAV